MPPLLLQILLLLSLLCRGESRQHTQVTEDNLQHLLTREEWVALFGTNNHAPVFAVVQPQAGQQQLVLEAGALGRRFQLQLQPALQLVDPQLVVLRRLANHSQLLPDLVEEHIGCHHRVSASWGEAAVTTCGSVRGIIRTQSNEHFIISPLPQRFHKGPSDIPHVLMQWKPGEPDNRKVLVERRHMKRKRSSSQLVGDSRDGDSSGGDPCAQSLREHASVVTTARGRGRRSLSPDAPVYVETAVFVDKDLFSHMAANYPTDTERELVRVVLAMVNAVQLLYHDPSLERQVNFVLKRVEILHADPATLQRSHDIDLFLSSFCTWQHNENPSGDSDPLHWDHALILTGLDLYVVSKNGKVSNQVVGLAPVAGMCTATSSCTVNEGRHFESVYVVAHEIGHNLGMRHDGPLADNDCDPSSFIMSPTLGSGKITWSPCSRRYLEKFLQTPQSQCLVDQSSPTNQLDHSAGGVLPGERFTADQQCMLKYGRGSIHSPQQSVADVCRDLHCQRDRYTWTSHPALEGTTCGSHKWCRSGRCISQGLSALQAGFLPHQKVDGSWSNWSSFSECASGCLFGDDGQLQLGSSGIMVSTRRCNNPRPENGGLPCAGSDRRFRTCNAEQCSNIPHTTIRDFANQICRTALELDSDLLGTGLQKISSDPEEACTVWCYKRSGGSKSRGWTFPDGTACHSHRFQYNKNMYCISGRCQEFLCDRYDAAIYSIAPNQCPRLVNQLFSRTKGRRRDVAEPRISWAPASGCHFNCMVPASGLRLVVGKQRHCWPPDDCKSSAVTSIQLCQPDSLGCGHLKTPFEHATGICSKYREHVQKLSGLGMQISPNAEDPDRPCRVACQDASMSHRFYLVNGEEGWFPFGTDCTRGVPDRKAFCISGKCLEFGPNDTPLQEVEYALPLLSRGRRSVQYNMTRVTSVLSQDQLQQIISQLNLSGSGYDTISRNYTYFNIDLRHPVHEESNIPELNESLWRR